MFFSISFLSHDSVVCCQLRRWIPSFHYLLIDSEDPAPNIGRMAMLAVFHGEDLSKLFRANVLGPKVRIRLEKEKVVDQNGNPGTVCPFGLTLEVGLHRTTTAEQSWS